MYFLFSVIIFIFTAESCTSDILSTSLYLYSPKELEYTDVIVKRLGDNLTLTCELRGELPALFVWNFVPANNTMSVGQSYTVEHSGGNRSWLTKTALSLRDSGRYVCSSPPFSITKYILVQSSGGRSCARGALWCGARCVLASYVCDGRADCARAEDEADELCGHDVCLRADRLNCTDGRCIPARSCCAAAALCAQHRCCDEHPAHAFRGLDAVEPLPPTEDRHSPDDFGFIQSTIYTVTACALIFLIAVVLLVSAACKMHMKRATRRNYANFMLNYHVQHAQRHLFPPCYEASDLLEQAANAPASPLRQPCAEGLPGSPSASERRRLRLTTLAAGFNARYRQVPTQCTDVEMSTARPPGETDRHRLTLQLGRFHLSIPNFRRSSEPRPDARPDARPDGRPDTPDVGELELAALDLVRLDAADTYTLNGRTIQLLGANFHHYPALSPPLPPLSPPLSPGGAAAAPSPAAAAHPPPYDEAVRYKLYGPPPLYLSRERLPRSVDEQARSNIEMPPGYDDLSGNNNDVITVTFQQCSHPTALAADSLAPVDPSAELNGNAETIHSVIDNLPAIDSDVNANDDA